MLDESLSLLVELAWMEEERVVKPWYVVWCSGVFLLRDIAFVVFVVRVIYVLLLHRSGVSTRTCPRWKLNVSSMLKFPSSNF